MKTELEIRQELRKVSRMLRACGGDDEMLYGAQQALGWVVERLKSPAEVIEVIHDIAETLAAE